MSKQAPFPEDFVNAARTVLEASRAQGRKIVTAESCTGGLISGALTAIPGSSDTVDRGFVTYSNTAKAEMLGVPIELLERYGAVSPETADAMCVGALAALGTDGIALSVTGIAGPGGGSTEKPVGLVYMGCLMDPNDPPTIKRFRFAGGRHEVRHATVTAGLDFMLRHLEGRFDDSTATPLTDGGRTDSGS